MLNGLFDIENRLDYPTENGDILPALKKLVPWENFRIGFAMPDNIGITPDRPPRLEPALYFDSLKECHLCFFFCCFLFGGTKFNNENISVPGECHANRNIHGKASVFPDFFPNSLTYATAET